MCTGVLSYNQSNVAKCISFKRTCKGCGKRFQGWDKTEACPECGADRHCGNDAVPGYTLCGNHGGPNPRFGFYGAGAPMTTGENSSHGLTRLAAKYNKLTTDGRFLSTQHSIHILRDRAEKLLEMIDQNYAPDRLADIEKLWGKYMKQKSAGQEVESIVTQNEIEDAFEAARTDFAAWSQLLQVLDLDRKMVESEVKIAKDIRAIMTAEEGVELVAKLLASVITAVGASNIPENDKGKLLKRIQYEFGRIIGEGIGEESAERFESGVEEIIDA